MQGFALAAPALVAIDDSPAVAMMSLPVAADSLESAAYMAEVYLIEHLGLATVLDSMLLVRQQAREVAHME